MDGFEKTKQRFWCSYMAFLIIGIVIMGVLAVGGLINIARSEGAAADQPLCIAVAAAQWPASIEGVDWVGYPQKWDVPPETFDQEPLLLPLGDWSEGAYALYRLDDGSDLIIALYELETDTPDMHTVCPDVVKWTP